MGGWVSGWVREAGTERAAAVTRALPRTKACGRSLSEAGISGERSHERQVPGASHWTLKPLPKPTHTPFLAWLPRPRAHLLQEVCPARRLLAPQLAQVLLQPHGLLTVQLLPRSLAHALRQQHAVGSGYPAGEGGEAQVNA